MIRRLAVSFFSGQAVALSRAGIQKGVIPTFIAVVQSQKALKHLFTFYHFHFFAT